MHPINKDILNAFARTNETLLTKPIRGVMTSAFMIRLIRENVLIKG
jgi:hypothetical protein